MGTPRRLAGPTQLAAAAATIYTVPALLSALIRHIHIQNPTGSVATVFTISVGADAAGTREYSTFALVAGGTPFDWYPYLPLTTGQIIQAFADVAASMVITIGGDEWVTG
jgi:hypothetical protein